MSSFPKILRETRLDEDKVILNRSCYAFRFIPRLLLRSPAFNLWLLQWTSPPRCQQPKKPTSIPEASAASVGQNNWWSQHGDNRFMRYQRQISHTLRSSWWNCQLNHSKIWSLNISTELLIPFLKMLHARCLKITEKVSFNIASEANYVLTRQKFSKNAKNWSILASFWKPEACGQTVLPDRSILIGQKLVENAKIEKLKCDILGDFQTLWLTPKGFKYDFFFIE